MASAKSDIKQQAIDKVPGKSANNKTKPSYKHVPHSQKPPHLVAKRNARERRRVQAVNQAFYKLRKCVPIENRNKRVSKVKTLQRAIDYIRKLERILSEDDEQQQQQPQQQQHLVYSNQQPVVSSSTQPAKGSVELTENKRLNKQKQPLTNCDPSQQQAATGTDSSRAKRPRKTVNKLPVANDVCSIGHSAPATNQPAQTLQHHHHPQQQQQHQQPEHYQGHLSRQPGNCLQLSNQNQIQQQPVSGQFHQHHQPRDAYQTMVQDQATYESSISYQLSNGVLAGSSEGILRESSGIAPVPAYNYYSPEQAAYQQRYPVEANSADLAGYMNHSGEVYNSSGYASSFYSSPLIGTNGPYAPESAPSYCAIGEPWSVAQDATPAKLNSSGFLQSPSSTRSSSSSSSSTSSSSSCSSAMVNSSSAPTVGRGVINPRPASGRQQVNGIECAHLSSSSAASSHQLQEMLSHPTNNQQQQQQQPANGGVSSLKATSSLSSLDHHRATTMERHLLAGTNPTTTTNTSLSHVQHRSTYGHQFQHHHLHQHPHSTHQQPQSSLPASTNNNRQNSESVSLNNGIHLNKRLQTAALVGSPPSSGSSPSSASNHLSGLDSAARSSNNLNNNDNINNKQIYTPPTAQPI